MKKKDTIFQKITGMSPYIWTVFSLLPFYFVFQSSSMNDILLGILLTILFFIFYRFAFISKGWPIYVWTVLLISISIAMTTLFSYVYFSFYFAFFLAYFIGNVQKWLTFITLYIIHLVSTAISLNYNMVAQEELFVRQLPVMIIIYMSVIIFPFTIYNRKKRERLEEQLEDANKRISELVKQEERQRIARDLHDTLGQKLSLIGLKSDLARKLINKDPEQARVELKDVQQTARTALNEVRKLVSQMRGIRLKEELVRVEQILSVAEIEFIHNELALSNVSPLTENILSMCLKEAVTNVVKHSRASYCEVNIVQSKDEIMITIQDNGQGIASKDALQHGNGLIGMRERLEFVNGTLDIQSDEGTKVIVKVPSVRKQVEKEEER
ncbi:sensor histidine kinase [Priestia aryabhattai]|uniref:sensor histidine kinase n=1 Tax=Bacillaceae TaxID=186817 RepID=UPI000BA11803|nr:sensor histidine kinase [Bacillus sp. CBEL-1]OZT14093.1 sensor histidine kinase [Priestia aryabhattai]TDB55099.1 sensor histidine kinase [Bacillus sp. CBEL-1]USY56518.1 sensor histidine kinase [Bacillus sp. 1780r2a1]